MKKKKEIIEYEEAVEINKSNYKMWQKKLKNVKQIGGYLYIYSDVKLDALESVGGDLDLDVILDKKIEEKLWKHNKKNKWVLTQKCSEYLLSKKGNIEYKINDIKFKKSMFDKIRKDRFTAKQVFLIKDIEQRRIVYELMDKIKMKDLKGKTLDRIDKDNYGYPMELIEIEIKGVDDKSRYLNCFDPSTGREYFVETRQKTCDKAKVMSFGFEEIIFEKEW